MAAPPDPSFTAVVATLLDHLPTLVAIGAVAWAGARSLARIMDEQKYTGARITNIELELKKQTEIMVVQAHHDARLDAAEQRMNNFVEMIKSLQDDMRELRHGRGFVRDPA